MKAGERWESGLRTHKEAVMRLADCIGYRMKNDQAVIWQEKLKNRLKSAYVKNNGIDFDGKED